MGLKPNEFFSVNIEGNYIKLTPVDIEPKYTKEEFEAVDRLVEREKDEAKRIKPGKEFSGYLKKLLLNK
jgi:hypothetical protein